ncbi:MAG TPA: hypothetical protein VFL92_03505 [Sphingomonas sp.]|nr:hypothetical protein [Sphingomonas sp.]
MGKFLKGALAAAVLAAGTVGVVAAPAQARSWHGYHHGWGGYHRGWYHHDNGGAAIAAGILGLGIGAAIASADQPDYYYGYDGYYAPPPPPPPRYYYAPPPPPAYGYYYGYGW